MPPAMNHPELDRTVTVRTSQVAALQRSGWALVAEAATPTNPPARTPRKRTARADARKPAKAVKADQNKEN